MTRHIKLLKFVSVGGLATLIDISIYILLYNLVHLSAPISSSISFILSAFINFILNNKFTFSNTESSSLHRIPVFYSIALGALFLNYILASIFTHVGLHYILTKILITGIVLIYNYLLHKHITFKI